MKFVGEKSVSSWLLLALRIAWWLGILGTASLLLAVIGLALAGDAVIPQEFASDLTINVSGLRIKVDEQYVNPMHRNLFLSLLLAASAMGGVVLAIIRNLQHLVASFADNNPFTVQNIRRLKNMGWLLFVWAVIEATSGITMGIMFAQMNRLPGLHVSANLRINMTTLLMAALSFVFAEIFRMGTKLRKDNELTI